jgi:hypothetical protein
MPTIPYVHACARSLYLRRGRGLITDESRDRALVHRRRAKKRASLDRSELDLRIDSREFAGLIRYSVTTRAIWAADSYLEREILISLRLARVISLAVYNGQAAIVG